MGEPSAGGGSSERCFRLIFSVLHATERSSIAARADRAPSPLRSCFAGTTPDPSNCTSLVSRVRAAISCAVFVAFDELDAGDLRKQALGVAPPGVVA